MMSFTDNFSDGAVVAIGDIHGRLDLFRAMMEKLRGSGATVICLGDLIDRGPDDVGVLKLAKELLDDPESWGLSSFYVLRGNHEDMFLNAIGELGDVELWVDNGGAYDKVEELREHAGWLSALPYYMTIGKTIFAHAGIPPGEDPATYMHDARKREDFVWQRRTVSKGAKLSKWTAKYKQVVFGHTPQFVDGGLIPLPYKVPGGVCIDSGAVYTDILTAYNVTNNTYVQVETELC